MMAARAKSRPVRWTGCNVLQSADHQGRLWRFGLGHGKAHLQDELVADRLPRQVVARTWRQLFQPRLNLAWLPAQHVYLRVVQLPAGDARELPSMLELQMEKLSPLPVTQVVWSYETLPGTVEGLQTVVVMIAVRADVEAFVGTLEPSGFQPDRLELPLLHRVLSEAHDADCTRLHLAPEGGVMACLAAWWQGGRLHSLDLITVPDTPQGARLWIDHLNQLAWAAEMEGWLHPPPAWQLILGSGADSIWESALREYGHGTLQVEAAATDQELATLSARRAGSGESQGNLLPAETAARYHQQFVDRLWMRSLGAVIVLYLLGVLAYMGAVKAYGYRNENLSQEVTALAPAYTNAVRLREQLRVFQEQAALKYAALNCLLIVSEQLPPSLTLEAFSFQGGTRLFLAGSVANEDQYRVTEFNADLRKATVDGEPLFRTDGVEPPTFAPRANNTYRWDFTATLNSPWLE